MSSLIFEIGYLAWEHLVVLSNQITTYDRKLTDSQIINQVNEEFICFYG